jgi:hypothetical protein
MARHGRPFNTICHQTLTTQEAFASGSQDGTLKPIPPLGPSAIPPSRVIVPVFLCKHSNSSSCFMAAEREMQKMSTGIPGGAV